MTTEEKLSKLEAEVAQLRQELSNPSSTFKWKYEIDNTFVVSEYGINAEHRGDEPLYRQLYIQHGRYRQTEESANHSLERNRVSNRLEALVEQVSGSYYKFNSGQENWSVYVNSNGMYDCSFDCRIFDPGKVYMNEETAETICRMLNNSEVKL
ncbi:MAG: hypothetical protein U9Q38_06420 [Thermodesulfobacteriota bacterium]|nr:hypothetical protein [Thermodesulfobacteriota bacterium]